MNPAVSGQGAARRVIRACCLAAATLLLRPLPLQAQPAPIWGEVTLPGGVAAARAALDIGDSDHRADAGWLLDVGHKYYAYSDSNPLVLTLQQYLEYLQSVSAAASAWPQGCQLVPSSAPRDERNRLKGYLELLGLRLKESRGRYSVDADDSRAAQQHAAWLKAAGIDVADLARRLTAGERVLARPPQARLPLPLPAIWRGGNGDRPLVASIVADRPAMLLYMGLMALDDETLTFLAARPALVRQLRDDEGPALAAFAGSIRVRGDAVDAPGDAAIWESLVGRRTQPAERFIRELLAADEGRMAWFYDTVDHLDPARQRFALGAHLKGKPRIEFVRRVYKAFAEIDNGWKLPVRPFFRPALDPALVLASIDVDGEKAAGRGWTPALLDAAVAEDSWPEKPERLVKGGSHQVADAAWLMQWIYANPRQARGRFDLLRFAQRRLAGSAAAPDALLALMTLRDMPALALALERMGVSDAALYAAAGRCARTLTRSGSVEQATPRLLRWQAALALLDQAQRRRHLAAATLQDLLRRLIAASQPARGGAHDAIGAWVFDALLPALGVDKAAAAGEDAERVALQAMTSAPSEEPLQVVWEGQRYVLDWAGATLRSALAIRAAATGPTLTSLATLLRAGSQLSAGFHGVEEARAAGGQLAALQARLDAGGRDASGHPLLGDLKETSRRLSGIKKASDLKKLSKLAPEVADVADRVTTAVLGSLTYALAVAPTGQPPAVYAELFRKHHLVDEQAHDPMNDAAGAQIGWQRAVWQPPVSRIEQGGGAAIAGSLLLLDLALAESQLRALTSDTTPSAAVLDADAVTLLQRVVVQGDRRIAPDAARQWVSAVRAGRQALATWHATRATPRQIRDALRAAAVGETRAALVVWEIGHGSSGSDPLTVGELARLGSAIAASPAADVGVVAAPLDGCACLEARPFLRHEEFGIRAGTGLLGAAVGDLPLRLLEILDEMRIATELMPALLSGAVADLRSHARSFGLNDWEASAAWTRALSRARVEDYLLGLQAARLLVAPDAAAAAR